ncbi:hypothetical protein HPB50_006827 [Hyalomma asiaticum]|uniref:Uncharacterized protein n=1 Tax=Hyalomma asiaticum TaxID=266040 RepID=A0ACB7S7Q5_HYAAI|nr:hypothetical protein HPB50_006827 [Hyalomma asiaticum]
MSSKGSSRSTTRDDAGEDSTSTLRYEGPRKENSGAQNQADEMPSSVTVESLPPMDEACYQSPESGVVPVSPEIPAKPAELATDDARRPSHAVVEVALEQPQPAFSEGGVKPNDVGGACSVTDEQRRFHGLSLGSLVLCGIILAFIVAAFAYAITFRAGRVLPRKAKMLARSANHSYHVLI